MLRRVVTFLIFATGACSSCAEEGNGVAPTGVTTASTVAPSSSANEPVPPSDGVETSAIESPPTSLVVQTTPRTASGVDGVSTASAVIEAGDSDVRPVGDSGVEIEYQDGVWMSLYEPEAAGCPDDGWPTIVTGGPSSSLFSKEFAGRGYLVAEVDWRAPGYTGSLDSGTLRAFQFAVNDLGVAVQWLRANAVEWCVDPGRIAAIGYSFGAITSLSLAYTRGELEVGSEVSVDELGGEGELAEGPVPPLELDPYPDDVGAVVSFAGFALPDTIEIGEPPALLFHGRDDGTIAFELAEQTCAAAVAVGVSCELVPHDSGHAMAEDIPAALDRADQFLRSELGIEDSIAP